MLLQRTLTSIVLLFLLGVLFFVIPMYLFAPIIILFATFAFNELLQMYNLKNNMQTLALLLFIALNTFSCFIHFDTSLIIRILIIIVWCFIIPIILISNPENLSKKIIFILGLMIFSFATYSLILLYLLLGAWQTLSILAIAWVADSGAYFIGKKFGKHKLAKNISPNKTIEGAIGGIVLVLVYLLILKFFNILIFLNNYLTVIKYAFVLSIASIVGDLFESYLKRVAKVKDSGKILPGHGGIFDRVDSLIAVIAIAFAMIRGLL